MVIVIDGDPEPQARMKFTRIGGFGRAYDPKAKEKELIRHQMKSKAALQNFDYPRISFIFYMPIPSGTSKKRLLEMQGERVKHIKRPDVDNLVKLYLDCMDGIIFERDEHVSLGLCVKIYSPKPRTVIMIQETTPLLQDWELHQAGGGLFGKLAFYPLESQIESYDPFRLSHLQCDHTSSLGYKDPQSGQLPPVLPHSE